MRCKSCLQIFSQPSLKTKETHICSICRGIKTKLKGHQQVNNLQEPQFSKNIRFLSKIHKKTRQTSIDYKERDKSQYILRSGLLLPRNYRTECIANYTKNGGTNHD